MNRKKNARKFQQTLPSKQIKIIKFTSEVPTKSLDVNGYIF